ncbi:electron transport complex subunit RsxG [Simiduia curdlanivorans]|uniref:Ion-translocating oxidoreductase complex subunit G n=1 Tax=Simiduia curdlanivorans TaxID=1492769 RepID=A0ABV8V6G6_9GAMM|nr:electron transport complex subunit RsxG [Simiduia curdlanivorans]MDN3638852.1 electron transport complex subunit RsxG [Simiduia curdlanivorans]
MKLLSSIGFNGLLLGGFAILTAAALATVNQLTLEPIAKAEQAAAQKALLEILPATTHDNDLLNDTLAIKVQWQKQLHTDANATIYRARMNEQINAVIIPTVAPDGYSGKIKMIVGINKDHSIAGVRVIKHTETPGLGDKVELKKSNWILSFNQKSLSRPMPEKWQVKKDGGEFDQFTGATITPRAAVKQIKKTLAFAQENHNSLFDINSTERQPEEPQVQP